MKKIIQVTQVLFILVSNLEIFCLFRIESNHGEQDFLVPKNKRDTEDNEGL